jgi:transcriptional regulator with XRE-family HTH domain
MNNIAGNIKRLRKEKGLSQEQMAERLHVTRQTVSAWERGVAQPGLDTLEEIARALEAEPERLLYGGQSGRQKPAYRAVSFWPVMGVLLLYFIMMFWILPIPMFALFGGGSGHNQDTVLILCGQMFLAMLMMFCYCALKDFIQNREFYDQSEEQEEEK